MRVETIGDATLYLADCRDVLPTLTGVDAVVTDPPYGVSYQGSNTKHSGKSGNGYASFIDTPEAIASVCVPAVRMAISIARCGVITPGNACSHLYDPPAAQGAIFYPSGANSGHWGFICSQPLLYYGRDPYIASGRRPNGFSTTEKAEENGHPCPNPIKQTEWMVWRASLEGWTVLDPFMGSGTTGVACLSMGRKFIGIEMDPTYFDIAVRRIEQAHRSPRLFGAPKDHGTQMTIGPAA